jgi:hypothetical protein
MIWHPYFAKDSPILCILPQGNLCIHSFSYLGTRTKEEKVSQSTFGKGGTKQPLFAHPFGSTFSKGGFSSFVWQ